MTLDAIEDLSRDDWWKVPRHINAEARDHDTAGVRAIAEQGVKSLWAESCASSGTKTERGDAF
jgi:hypothetical protein